VELGWCCHWYPGAVRPDVDDVIRSFWIPGFRFKHVPGQMQTFQVDVGDRIISPTPASAPSSAGSTTTDAVLGPHRHPRRVQSWLQEARAATTPLPVRRHARVSDDLWTSAMVALPGEHARLPRTLIGWLTATGHEAISRLRGDGARVPRKSGVGRHHPGQLATPGLLRRQSTWRGAHHDPAT
jgi:hypothetical protein